jgi:hypothetical protein
MGRVGSLTSAFSSLKEENDPRKTTKIHEDVLVPLSVISWIVSYRFSYDPPQILCAAERF